MGARKNLLKKVLYVRLHIDRCVHVWKETVNQLTPEKNMIALG